MDNFRSRNHFVGILSVFFGLSSWVAVNGIWVELPIMVPELPEGWDLPSYLSVIIQIANIAPIIYTICNSLKKGAVSDSLLINVMLVTGATACLLLGFFWNYKTFIGNSLHSTALFALVFFVSIVDCTSPVLYLPFMGRYKKEYLMSYLIGESLSGFLPAVIATIQGAGSSECRNVTIHNETSGMITYSYQQVFLAPKFSVEIFFFFLCGMMVASWAAFCLLMYLPSVQHELVATSDSNCDTEASVETSDSDAREKLKDNKNIVTNSEAQCVFGGERHSAQSNYALEETSALNFKLLLILQAWICFLSNGVLPSLQTYSSLPYGNTTYHLVVTLSSIAGPVACVIAMFIQRPQHKFIYLLSLGGSLVSVYVLSAAILSPSPPLTHSILGQLIIVSAWIFISGMLTFAKVFIANVLRDQGCRALFWYGVCTQAGSSIGAVVIFIAVGVLHMLTSYQPCKG